MLIADTYLGQRDDHAIQAKLAESDPLRVVLTDTERRRSRVRTTTEDGTDLGIVVADELADGAVLSTDEGDLVVVELASIDAFVLDFADAEVAATAALEVGHALGNRHWDLAVRGEEALFPVTESRERMEATVREVLPDGVTVGYESVSPTTFDDGGADHEHSHDGHKHTHDDGHGHSHEHPHEHGVRTIDGGER